MTAAIPVLGASERRLLLACSRVEIDDAHRAEAAELCRAGLDWEAILFHAELHSVGPLLHRNLSALEAPAPGPARARLLELSHRAAYQNRLFAAEHQRLLDAFEAAGVRVIVPKGISVAEELYGDLSLRPLIDLIYLVEPVQLERARQVTAELGYARFPMNRAEKLYRWSCPQLYLRRHGELPFLVLLQPTPATWPRFHRLATGPLFERARRVELAGRGTLLLRATDLLLYLCLQADNQGHFNRVAIDTASADELLWAEWSNNRLVRFVDINEAARHHREVIDWEALVERATEARIEDAVHASLTLTGELLGTIAPPPILERLRARRPQRTRLFLYESLSERRDGWLSAATRRGWGALSGWSKLRVARLLGMTELLAAAARARATGEPSPLLPMLGTRSSPP